ncbi:MAG: DHH family phosphoesterase [Bacillaceae bacterium]
MSEIQKKRWFLYPVLILLTIFVIVAIIIFAVSKWIGIMLLIILGAVSGWFYKVNQQIKKEINQYTELMMHRVKKVSDEAFNELPIGILLYNRDYQIQWANPYLLSCFEETVLVGQSVEDVSENLMNVLKRDLEQDLITLNNRKFKVIARKNEQLVYFFDITEQTEIERLYQNDRTVMAVIYLDNYDEVTQGADDQSRTQLNSLVTAILNDWALEYGIFLKRVSSDRYMAILNEHILVQLEKSKFSILDQVKEQTQKRNILITLSIGVGSGDCSLPELGALAQSGLDLALGRGGDQVAIKHTSGKSKFYGGKSNPVEKRTRVRARVISHALKDLIIERKNVLIMGHKMPDMDAVGASIGIAMIAKLNNRQPYIVLNENQIDDGVRRLVKEVKNTSELSSQFITPEAAMEMASEDTLLVIVDTHKPSLVIEEKLLKMIDNVVVIDHHRRAEEFIKDPVLVYMEPYASSTCELVTELLEYQAPKVKMKMLEATALLAGIIVDTKSFTFRTGTRTFDAASYLRAQGADTVLVQTLLKEDIDVYVKRSKLIERAVVTQDGIAIAKGLETDYYNQVLIAQAADTLLSMTNIVASFVIAKKNADTVGISGRSLGDINVQVIMEQMNGGGHLTNAATQLKGTIAEAESELLQCIDSYLEGGNEQ